MWRSCRGLWATPLAMPDIHWGYGFPIGGVAATRVEDGVVSPGGVGYDINCGVRLLRTNLREDEVRPKIEELLSQLFNNVPSGLGSTGKIKVGKKEMDDILTDGARWAVKRGFGTNDDLDVTEEGGCLKGADPDEVSVKAKERGSPQSGTLGSGNHFLEVEVVGEIYEQAAARAMGIDDVGQVLLLIHTGSRGLGHQVCDDYIRTLREAMQRYGIEVPDRELACAPVKSAEGRDYLAAMACAANYAWANRQCITHWSRECFVRVFGRSLREIGLEMVYDVAHNIAKIESYEVNGKKQNLCVHRKGATRAFPAGHPSLPARYKEVGQPVLIPGDMGRYSFVAVGTDRAVQGILRLSLPRRGEKDEPPCREAWREGRGCGQRPGSQGHCRHGSQQGRIGRRGLGSLQRRGRGGGGLPSGGPVQESGQDLSSRRSQGIGYTPPHTGEPFHSGIGQSPKTSGMDRDPRSHTDRRKAGIRTTFNASTGP